VGRLLGHLDPPELLRLRDLLGSLSHGLLTRA
jgi:hypothetical protein